jgi:hypothetical protein
MSPLDILLQATKQKIKDTAGKMFNFVQQNPTPVGFAMKPAQQAIQNFSQKQPKASQFLISKVEPQVQRFSSFMQNPYKPVQLPIAQVQAPINTPWLAKVPAQVGVGAYNNLIKPIAEGILDIPRDIIGGATKTGLGLAHISQSQPNAYKDTLAGIGQIGTGVLNASILPTGGKIITKASAEAVKKGFLDSVKEGAITGGKFGLAYGLSQGLVDSKDIKDVYSYVGNVAKSTGVNTIGGVVLGGGMAGIGYGVGKVFGKITQFFQEHGSKNPTQDAKAYIRNSLGQFAKGGDISDEQIRAKLRINPQDPVTYGDLNEYLGLPRNPQAPQIGMTTKPLTLKEHNAMVAPSTGGEITGTVYHGGSKIDQVNLRKSNHSGTFYVTDDPNYAKSFGGKGSVVNEMTIDPKAKLIDMRKPTEAQITEITKAIEKATEKNVPYGDKNFSFYPYSEKDVIQGLRDGKANYAELPQIKQILKNLGYDGQITAEVPYAKNIGIWNKDLVKPISNISNNGQKNLPISEGNLGVSASPTRIKSGLETTAPTTLNHNPIISQPSSGGEINIYHGTNAPIKSISEVKPGDIVKPGMGNSKFIYVSENPEIAKAYSKTLPNGQVLNGKLQGKVLDAPKGLDYLDFEVNPKLADKYIKDGYSAIRFPNPEQGVKGSQTQLLILDGSKISSGGEIGSLPKSVNDPIYEEMFRTAVDAKKQGLKELLPMQRVVEDYQAKKITYEQAISKMKVLDPEGYKRNILGEIGKGGETLASKISVGKAPIKQPILQTKQPTQTQLLEQKTSLPTQPVSLPTSIPQDPIQKVIQALKGAKPIRAEQQAMYSNARSQQVAKIAAMGAKVPGEKGYFAQLGQLKGELPKVQFEGIRKQITQPDIDSLFDSVEKSAISPFEKITAKTGLAKLLGADGGQVPTKGELNLLGEIFPPEFVQAVLDKRSTMQKLFSLGENALNLPRSIMATADLSAPLRQGVFLIGRPKQWIPAFRDMFKYAFSEKAYRGLGEQIKTRPTYQLMRENKLALTDMSQNLLSREEAFMSTLVEKIPGFGVLAKGSNRAYSGFLNKLRADTFDDLLKNAKIQGLDVKAIAPDVAKFVNAATGRGDLGALNKASVVLNGAFFSPRLMASRLNLLNPVYYAQLNPFVRKEALKSLFTFAGTAMSILGLAKLGGADVGTDPRSADFGKIKTGDTRYDPWGGFQQYIVLASRLLTNQMVSSTTGKEFTFGEGYKPTTRLDIIQRFFESKTSPVASFVLALLKGQTAVGEKTRVPVEIIDRLMPMMAQDMYDLYRENGLPGLAMAIPGIFGVGSQTYTDQIPMAGKTAMGKPNVQWRQAPGLGETILNKVTGTQISNIPQEQWQPLVEQKKAETQWNIKYTAAKTEVLESGKAQTIDNPITGKKILIYLDNGVVKTKEIKPSTKTKKQSSAKVKSLRVKVPKLAKIKKPKKIKAPKLAKLKKIKKNKIKVTQPKLVNIKPLLKTA